MSEKIKVGFISSSSSSTLYRGSMIMEEMARQNETVYRINSIDEIPKFDINILYIHLLFNSEYVQAVSSAKKRGIITVLDIVDDFMEAKDMLKEVDAVTTNSIELFNFCEKLSDKQLKIYMIADPIRLPSPLPSKVHSKKDGLKILFFASPCNLDNIDLCRNALIKLRKEKQFTLTYFSSNSKQQSFKKLNALFLKWEISSFTHFLSRFDLAIIPQKKKYKSINKLMESISHNLPAVSSDIPMYRQFAEQTNTAEFLCKNEEEWYENLLKMFNPDARNQFLLKTFDYLWQNYNVSVITRKYIDFFYQLLRERE